MSDDSYSQLSAYADNELTPAERTAIEQKLQQSEELRDRLRQYREVNQMLVRSLAQIEPPQELKERVRRKLEAALADIELDAIAQPRPVLPSWVPWAAAAAVAASFFLIAAWHYGRSSVELAHKGELPLHAEKAAPTRSTIAKQVTGVTAAIEEGSGPGPSASATLALEPMPAGARKVGGEPSLTASTAQNSAAQPLKSGNAPPPTLGGASRSPLISESDRAATPSSELPAEARIAAETWPRQSAVAPGFGRTERPAEDAVGSIPGRTRPHLGPRPVGVAVNSAKNMDQEQQQAKPGDLVLLLAEQRAEPITLIVVDRFEVLHEIKYLCLSNSFAFERVNQNEETEASELTPSQLTVMDIEGEEEQVSKLVAAVGQLATQSKAVVAIINGIDYLDRFLRRSKHFQPDHPAGRSSAIESAPAPVATRRAAAPADTRRLAGYKSPLSEAHEVGKSLNKTFGLSASRTGADKAQPPHEGLQQARRAAKPTEGRFATGRTSEPRAADSGAARTVRTDSEATVAEQQPASMRGVARVLTFSEPYSTDRISRLIAEWRRRRLAGERTASESATESPVTCPTARLRRKVLLFILPVEP